MGSEPVMTEMIFISLLHRGQVRETSKTSWRSSAQLFFQWQGGELGRVCPDESPLFLCTPRVRWAYQE